MGNKNNRRNSTAAQMTPIRPSVISDLTASTNALDLSGGFQHSGNSQLSNGQQVFSTPTTLVSSQTSSLNGTVYGESPLSVRPSQHPTGQIKPPYAPKWEQIYVEDTSEPFVVNTLLLDGQKKHKLNALWEQLDALKFTNSADEKKYKTSIIAEAKQLFQNALDMYFIGSVDGTTFENVIRQRDQGAEDPEGLEMPQRVRLGYFFRTHAKGFMITCRSDEELWLARDHADQWMLNLFHPACGGFGRRMATGVPRLFEVWGGIILKNIQLSEDLLQSVFEGRPNSTPVPAPGSSGSPPSTQAAGSRDRPRFDQKYCREFERNNPMVHSVTGKKMQYRVRRMEYMGGARRGHTIAVFFHDRDSTEYFFVQVGTAIIFDQIIPVIDFYRQNGNNNELQWEHNARSLNVEETRARNVRFAKERTEKFRAEQIRIRAMTGVGHDENEESYADDGDHDDGRSSEGSPYDSEADTYNHTTSSRKRSIRSPNIGDVSGPGKATLQSNPTRRTRGQSFGTPIPASKVTPSHGSAFDNPSGDSFNSSSTSTLASGSQSRYPAQPSRFGQYQHQGQSPHFNASATSQAPPKNRYDILQSEGENVRKPNEFEWRN